FEGGRCFSDGEFTVRKNNRFFISNKIKNNILCICMVFQYDSVGRLFYFREKEDAYGRKTPAVQIAYLKKNQHEFKKSN
ncbi:MAG: hypothetical protein MR010_04520, partial [Lachnospiraceae bacterium]|nr:hypothetical protein [Lachnospiraceae bacterium]